MSSGALISSVVGHGYWFVAIISMVRPTLTPEGFNWLPTDCMRLTTRVHSHTNARTMLTGTIMCVLKTVRRRLPPVHFELELTKVDSWMNVNTSHWSSDPSSKCEESITREPGKSCNLISWRVSWGSATSSRTGFQAPRCWLYSKDKSLSPLSL